MPWFIVAIVLKMVLAWIESQIKSSENIAQTMQSTVPNATDVGFANRLGKCQGHLMALQQVRDKIKTSLELRQW